LNTWPQTAGYKNFLEATLFLLVIKKIVNSILV